MTRTRVGKMREAALAKRFSGFEAGKPGARIQKGPTGPAKTVLGFTQAGNQT